MSPRTIRPTDFTQATPATWCSRMMHFRRSRTGSTTRRTPAALSAGYFRDEGVGKVLPTPYSLCHFDRAGTRVVGFVTFGHGVRIVRFRDDVVSAGSLRRRNHH